MKNIDKKKLKETLKQIESLTLNDYKVKLGSLIDPEFRKYYVEKNFKILKMHIEEVIIP